MTRGQRVAAFAVSLGLLGAAAYGISLAVHGRLGLGIFVALFAGFHLLEFAVTALLRPAQLSLESFAFNGLAYAGATLLALGEYALEAEAFASLPGRVPLIVLGTTVAIAGWALRLWSMITAAESFNHAVQTRVPSNHTLVEDGPYRWLRHPSYTGYYWFSLGTQVVLLNPLSLLVYALVLARFFRDRVPPEEAALVERFGRRYETFRATRRLLIPGAGV